MSLTKNKYYFEALDCYPYNLADCLGALNYALSYDPEDSDALCLMGRIYSEQLKNYEQAKTYFQEALACDVGNVTIPKYYVSCLLNNEDYEEALKLLDFSFKTKGIDKSNILYWKSVYFEKLEHYDEALKTIKEAKKISYNKDGYNRVFGKSRKICEVKNAEKESFQKEKKENQLIGSLLVL